jgi:hypothetical protein
MAVTKTDNLIVKIRIKEENLDQIQTYLEDWQTLEKCRIRRIDAYDVQTGVELIEKFLSGILHKKDWTGLTFLYDHYAQDFPGAYNGTPASTQIIITRRFSGWFLSNLYRGDCARASNALGTCNLEIKTEEIINFLQDNTTKLAHN